MIGDTYGENEVTMDEFFSLNKDINHTYFTP